MRSAGCVKHNATRQRQMLLGGAAPLGTHAGVTLPILAKFLTNQKPSSSRVCRPPRARYPVPRPLRTRHVSLPRRRAGARGLGRDVTRRVRAVGPALGGWRQRLATVRGARAVGPTLASSWPRCRFLYCFFFPSLAAPSGRSATGSRRTSYIILV